MAIETCPDCLRIYRIQRPLDTNQRVLHLYLKDHGGILCGKFYERACYQTYSDTSAHWACPDCLRVRLNLIEAESFKLTKQGGKFRWT